MTADEMAAGIVDLWETSGTGYGHLEQMIYDALVAERVKAVAALVVLAQELEQESDDYSNDPAAMNAKADAAARIREALR